MKAEKVTFEKIFKSDPYTNTYQKIYSAQKVRVNIELECFKSVTQDDDKICNMHLIKTCLINKKYLVKNN